MKGKKEDDGSHRMGIGSIKKKSRRRPIMVRQNGINNNRKCNVPMAQSCYTTSTNNAVALPSPTIMVCLSNERTNERTGQSFGHRCYSPIWLSLVLLVRVAFQLCLVPAWCLNTTHIQIVHYFNKKVSSLISK